MDLKTVAFTCPELPICRLCFRSESREEFSYIYEVSEIVNVLLGSEPDLHNEVFPQRICAGCREQLHSAIRIRKRISFSQQLWSRYWKLLIGISDAAHRRPREEPVDDRLEWGCHVCRGSFTFPDLVSHIESVHSGEAHLADCRFCVSIINKQAEDCVGSQIDEENCIKLREEENQSNFQEPFNVPPEIIEVVVEEENEEQEEVEAESLQIDQGEDDQMESIYCLSGDEGTETNSPKLDGNNSSQFKPFACELCRQGFCSKYRLKNHLIRVHKLPVESRTIKPGPDAKFPCDFCGKELKTAGSYVTHLRTHEKRPFHCSVCDEGFRTVQKQKDHEFVCLQIAATGKQKVPCLSCNMWFSNSDELRVHKVEKHPIHRPTTIKRMETSGVKRTMATEDSQDNFLVVEQSLAPPDDTIVVLEHCTDASMDDDSGENQRFACHLCNVSYARHPRLKMHLWSSHKIKLEKVHIYREKQ